MAAIPKSSPTPAPGASPSSTAGTTGSPPTPFSTRLHTDKALHGNADQISTNTNARALKARADHGLTSEGAQSFARGQQPAFLGDQTRLLGHEATHVIQQR